MKPEKFSVVWNTSKINFKISAVILRHLRKNEISIFHAHHTYVSTKLSDYHFSECHGSSGVPLSTDVPNHSSTVRLINDLSLINSHGPGLNLRPMKGIEREFCRVTPRSCDKISDFAFSFKGPLRSWNLSGQHIYF